MLRHHHRAERARIGIERQLGAELALARHPQPVRDHHVGAAAAQRDLAGLGAGEFGDLQRQGRPACRGHARGSPQVPRRMCRFSAPQSGWFVGAGYARHPGEDGCQQQAGKEIHRVLVVEDWMPSGIQGRFLMALLSFHVIIPWHRIAPWFPQPGGRRWHSPDRHDRISARWPCCSATVVAARAEEVNDYPTVARSEYVFGCLKANGETRQAIEQCSCSIDVIASLLPYDRYVTGETVLSMAQVRGNLGANSARRSRRPARSTICGAPRPKPR